MINAEKACSSCEITEHWYYCYTIPLFNFISTSIPSMASSTAYSAASAPPSLSRSRTFRKPIFSLYSSPRYLNPTRGASFPSRVSQKEFEGQNPHLSLCMRETRGEMCFIAIAEFYFVSGVCVWKLFLVVGWLNRRQIGKDNDLLNLIDWIN